MGGCTSPPDGRVGITGGGYLRLLPPEHSCKVYCNQYHHGPVSGDGAKAGVKGGQAVVVSGRIGLGGDADSSWEVERTERGGEKGREIDGDGYGLNWWEDNVVNIILGTEPNAPLAYAPGLELHYPIISTLGVHLICSINPCE